MNNNALVLLALTGLGAFAVSKAHYIYRWLSLGGPIISPQPKLNELSDHPLLPNMKRKILVLMAYTTNIADYGDISASINKRFADRHGYDFILYRTNERPPESKDGRHITWDKIAWIMKAFQEHKDTDFVFWIDCDAYFADQSKKLEGIIPGGGDISICCNTRLSKNTNTGAMLVRRCPWSFNFLCELWKMGAPDSRWHKEKYHEQSALDEMMIWDTFGMGKSHPFTILTKNKIYTGCSTEGHIALFKSDAFNTDAMDKSSDSLKVLNQFVVHRMGTSAEYRKSEFTKYRNLLFS